MKTLPVNPTENQTPEALRAFFAQCCEMARAAGRPQLVSISVAVDSLDPLAVLESIYEPTEPHFYIERPAQGFAVAGAEVVVEFTTDGPQRFARAKDFIAATLESTIAVGAMDAPFAGPHFFLAAAPSDQIALHDEDVRRLQHRVAEQPIRRLREAVIAQLVLQRRDALHPWDRNEPREVKMQLGDLRHE